MYKFRYKLLGIMSFCFLSLFFVSCDTNRSTISELESLKEELETKADTFDEEDWRDFSERYENLNERMSKREFTAEERREIRKLKGKITGKLTKKALEGFKKRLEDLPKLIDEAAQSANDFLEGFAEEIEE